MFHVVYLTIIAVLGYRLWKREQVFDPRKDRIRALVEKLETLRARERTNISFGHKTDETVKTAIGEIEAELELIHQQDSEKQTIKYLS